MGTNDLWNLWSAVSDTEYMINSDILDVQHRFAMNDVFNDEQISFLNCLDKRRITLACMQHGRGGKIGNSRAVILNQKDILSHV